MCLGNKGTPEPVKKTPILPGPASKDDSFNDASIPNQTDRSRQTDKRGETRDYRGRDKYRHFDEDAARTIK